MKILLPDACWKTDIVSGALFLYFHDETIWFTLHSSVSAFLTGIDPHKFFQLVEQRRPSWAQKFFNFVQYWELYRHSLEDANKLLEPLRGTAFKTILLSYPRGDSALESSMELLSSSNLPKADIINLIDLYSASDEFFSHIFFEKYLELYFPNHTIADFVRMTRELAEAHLDQSPIQVDWTQLYQYCDGLFAAQDLEWLLAAAYMFRLKFTKDQIQTVLLSNESLIRFLESLPVELIVESDKKRGSDSLDIAAWEFFRQLVSPMLDPLDEKRIRKISGLIHDNGKEIGRLKSKCLRLAQDLGNESNMKILQNTIKTHIRVNVDKEVQELLDIDKKALRELLNLVFSDEKTWAGIAAFLYSLVNGGPWLTAGSAIYALSSVGSKSFKAAAKRREKIRASDYTLLYRMKS
jgi:hypothetical protein